MALLDGLLHCYTPSLGPTGYRLIDRGPRLIHGVADTGVTSSMWAGSFNRWCLRGTAAASQRFSGCGTFPAGNRTVMVWWKAQVTLAQFTTRAAFFQGAQVTGQSFHLTIFHDASGVTGAMLGQWGDNVTVPFGNDGRWHCIVGTNTGTSYEIYVDGVSRGTKTMATTQTTTPPEIFGASGLSFWEGDLGEVAWWNRILTPAEIMKLYRDGDGAIGRSLTGQAFPRRRVSQAIAAGGATPWLYARRRSQIIGAGGVH